MLFEYSIEIENDRVYFFTLLNEILHIFDLILILNIQSTYVLFSFIYEANIHFTSSFSISSLFDASA